MAKERKFDPITVMQFDGRGRTGNDSVHSVFEF